MIDQNDNIISNGNDLIESVCSLLQKVNTWKWRNTSALARELKVDKETLLKALASHASKPDRRVRYHPKPSRHRMDILWGLVDVVGEDNHLPSLTQHDSPENEIHLNVEPSSPWVFLSHNHRDVPRVLEISKAMADMDVGCWLYETHIEFNATIIPKVREGLEQCCGLIVYVSAHSIGSLWVQKEFGFALEELNKPTMIVLDGSDVQLINCFKKGQEHHQIAERVSDYARSSAAKLGISSLNDRIRIANEFARQVSNFAARDGVVILYPVPSQYAHTRIFNYGDINKIKQWASNLR